MAKKAAFAAGELISQFINDSDAKTVNTKLNHTDLVTAIDKKCEVMIIEILKQSYPNHKIIAEESHADTSKFDITDAPTWFIDPIDGTTNFFHAYHYCAVSIGLRINQKVLCANLRNNYGLCTTFKTKLWSEKKGVQAKADFF